MTEIFNTVLDMSITASLVIIAVLLVRLLLKKAPKKWSYALWLLVLLRLLCPISIESGLSLIPAQSRNIPQNTALDEDVDTLAAIDAAQRAVGDTLNGGIEPILINVDRPETKGIETVSASHSQVWLLFFARLWPVGIAAMLVWSAVSYLRLRLRLRTAVRFEDNVYECDDLASPFVLGIFRPKIYLPSGLGDREKVYIIEHERQHLRRGDHIFKLLAYAALCLHWFNPLVWLAFVLSEKDMELSCDEAVIDSLGGAVRADYSASLLSLATGRRIIAGMPLAFGEGDPKGRIKNLAAWKKPAVWVSVVAVIVLVAAAVCLLTDRPEKPMEQDDLKIAIITEDGYTIRNQMVDLGLRVPKEVLTEAAYTPEGQSFGECEVVVYDGGRTKIWLKSVRQANESASLLYFGFDMSHDLQEHGGAFFSVNRYEGEGSTVCTSVGGVHNEVLSADNGDFEAAVSLRGVGPDEELTFYVRADAVRQAKGTMVMEAALNQVIYSLGEALSSVPEEPASSTDVEYIEPQYDFSSFAADPEEYGQERDIAELWYTELRPDGTVDIGVNLVYDDDTLLVFQAERGLYAYDFASERILIAVNTEKAVGVWGYQGTAPCAVVRVLPETQTIQLYNSHNEAYCIYIDPYRGVYWFDEFVDLDEDEDKAGRIYSDHRAVGMISEQYYYLGEEKWELFANFEFPAGE